LDTEPLQSDGKLLGWTSWDLDLLELFLGIAQQHFSIEALLDDFLLVAGN
jgi:hypothetical protein